MRKVKLISLIVLFCSISATSYSQTDSIMKRSKPNEIGLNVGPVLLIAMGSDPYPQPIGITYKSLINKFAYKIVYNYHSNGSSPYAYEKETNYLLSDSLKFDIVKQSIKLKHDFRIGAEYRLAFKNRMALFFGLDLVMAYSEMRMTTNKSIFKIDSISLISNLEPNYYLSSVENRIQSRGVDYIFNSGLGINIGMIIPVSKRFQFSFSHRSDLVLSSIYTVNKDYQSKQSDKFRYNRFDFDFGTPISEIGFYYRF